MQLLSQGFYSPINSKVLWKRVKNNHTKEIVFRMLCYEKVVLLLSVTVKILYLECCVMKKLLYCCFFV